MLRFYFTSSSYIQYYNCYCCYSSIYIQVYICICTKQDVFCCKVQLLVQPLALFYVFFFLFFFFDTLCCPPFSTAALRFWLCVSMHKYICLHVNILFQTLGFADCLLQLLIFYYALAFLLLLLPSFCYSKFCVALLALQEGKTRFCVTCNTLC